MGYGCEVVHLWNRSNGRRVKWISTNVSSDGPGKVQVVRTRHWRRNGARLIVSTLMHKQPRGRRSNWPFCRHYRNTSTRRPILIESTAPCVTVRPFSPAPGITAIHRVHRRRWLISEATVLCRARGGCVFRKFNILMNVRGVNAWGVNLVEGDLKLNELL